MSAIHFRFLYFMAAVLLFLCLISGCRKDTSPIGNDDRPERPTTGDAILTGRITGGTEPVDMYVFFYDDYRDTLAHIVIDTVTHEYYIENLPEDTVDLVFTQSFLDRDMIADKVTDLILQKDTNTVDHYLYFGYYILYHDRIYPDHFVVKFDSTYAWSAIDSFNATNDILSVSYYEDPFSADWHAYLGNGYHFLEIDPQRDIFQVIDTYMQSDLTIYAYPVFNDYPDHLALWWVGTTQLYIKPDIAEEKVLEMVEKYHLLGVERGVSQMDPQIVYYDIYVSKLTDMSLLELLYEL